MFATKIVLAAYMLYILESSSSLKKVQVVSTVAPVNWANPDYECYCANSPQEGCGFLEPLASLVNQPEYAPGQEPPCLIYSKQIFVPRFAPKFSIIVTVHFQEGLINGNIQALLDKTIETWELIVVFDAASKQCVLEVIKALQEAGCIDPENERIDIKFSKSEFKPPLHRSCSSTNLIGIKLINQSTPVFETTSNNIGMRASSGEYYILLQEDMRIEEMSWNSLLSVPAIIFDDVLGISARCAHGFNLQNLVGADCGSAGDQGDRCELNVRDTANRGPLLLRGMYVKQLGYLDEQNFYLEWDEHDLFARGWFQHNWVAAWYYINFTHFGHGNVGLKDSFAETAEEAAFKRYRQARSGGGFFWQVSEKSCTHDETRHMNLSSCM